MKINSSGNSKFMYKGMFISSDEQINQRLNIDAAKQTMP